jgi:membrane protein
MKFKLAPAIFKNTFTEFGEDKAMRLGAALAYYSVFSLAPLLLIAIGVAGLLFGEKYAHQQVSEQLSGLLGAGAAQTLESMMAARDKDSSLVATIVGMGILIFGASGVFGQLQDALNTIWEVKPKSRGGIWGFIRTRFLSMAMVLGTGFLLLVSLILTTVVSAAAGYMERITSVPESVLHVVNLILAFGVVTLLFAMIFKFLPDVNVKWRDVVIGAIGTALLFTGGKYLLGLYLGRETVASAYGAAGSFVVLLLWVYYSSLILLFGAEFTQVYAKQTGSWIAPSANARPVTDEERAQEGVPHEINEPQPVYARREEPVQRFSPTHPKPRRVAQGAGVREMENHPYQLAVLVGTAFLLPILLRKQGVKFVRDLAAAAKRRHGLNKRAVPG